MFVGSPGMGKRAKRVPPTPTPQLGTATEKPGQDMPAFFQGKSFKKGQTVTFKYRELTDDGIPKEARYWRRRDAE